jgi:hypothetical protein
MKPLLIISLLFSFCYNTYSFGEDPQFKKPDYEAIRKATRDKKSAFYYPVLMKRYNDGDTTINEGAFNNLYFGYLFDPGYSVFDRSVYNDSISAILKQDTVMADDYKRMIRYENAVLRQNPFNIRDLNRLANAYYYTGDTLNMLKTGFKLQMIANTILATGDGMSETAGWHVISVGHEYDLLHFLGFSFGGQQSLTDSGCDYLTVGENKQDIKGFYFDVRQILEKEREMLKLK